MEHIRVRNLRCLVDSTRIEIKPITLLVGANSSGKSTFLRVLPLLRQSQEMRTLGGLVLNEGDVDFGFFDAAIHRGATPPELALEFGFPLRRGIFQGSPFNQFLIEDLSITCELTYVQRSQDSRYPRLQGVRLNLKSDSFEDHISIKAEDAGSVSELLVNSFKANQDERQHLRIRISRGVVPQLTYAWAKQDSFPDGFDLPDRVSSPFDRRLLIETSTVFHGRTAEETRLATLRAIPIGSPEKMLSAMRSTGSSYFSQKISAWHTDHMSFRSLRNLLLAKRISDILESVNIYLSQFARSIHYFQPVRAVAQRDYLVRDVSTASVNSSGLNVAMVLSSFSRQEQGRFRQWMLRHFGFEVFPESVGDGARVSLRLKDPTSGAEFNLADTGFGFSQMLPFLVQIWSLLEGRPQLHRVRPPFSRVPPSAMPASFTIVIEQPELHLHPALQARLADLIVLMTKLGHEKGLAVRFVLETHSQTIIERIGQSIDCGDLQRDHAQVILFELANDHLKPNRSLVRSAEYDQNGVLVDWPFGFLSAPLSYPTSTQD